MLTRRACLVGLASAPFAAAAQPKLSDDGMYEFDWYLESFLDLKEDIETAVQAGKRLAVIVSQRACPYCKRMAEEHFSTPRIVDYVRANFEVLHLNLFGAREVTDLDGKKMSERDFARAQGVRATPTIFFYPKSTEGLAQKPPQQREVARMPGLLEPEPFLAMFRYVKEEAYLRQSFPDWLKTQG
jgi:thioredoxin-related protein